MTLVFCHYIQDDVVIVTDSHLCGGNGGNPKCAAFPNMPVAFAWWGDYDLEPQVLADDPTKVGPNKREFAAANCIWNKLPAPADARPCFQKAFLTEINKTPHVHNGNRQHGGLIMCLAMENRIRAFVYENTAGRGSWQLMDDTGVQVWPQVFGNTASLRGALREMRPAENDALLLQARTTDKFAETCKRWIEATGNFEKAQHQCQTVGLPAFRLVLRSDGVIEGPTRL